MIVYWMKTFSSTPEDEVITSKPVGQLDTQTLSYTYT